MNSTDIDLSKCSQERAAQLFAERQQGIFRWTDRLFAWLLPLQWVAGIGVALWVSPRTWAGANSAVHLHVFLALLLGLAIISLPVLLAILRPGCAPTRHATAIGQVMMSALLIHLTGGRIETHFHIFGSLALLAFYRDWRVLCSASVVVALDHLIRGVVWPQSVFGTLVESPWRSIEHAGWVVVEDVFLIYSGRYSLREMWSLAQRQAWLEATNEIIERDVALKTSALRASEAHNAAILEAAPDAMVIINSQGEIVLVNSRTEQLFGHMRAELLGRPVEILVPRRFRDKHPGQRDRYFSEPRTRPMGGSVQLYGSRKDGHEFPVEISLGPLETEKGVLVCSAIRDITQRRQAEHRLKTEHAVTRILAESASLEEAAPLILQELCQCLQWEVGALWRVDRPAGLIRCVEVWHDSTAPVREFAAVTRRTTFMPGTGIPGRVWFDGRAAWVADIAGDTNFPRAPFAMKEGLHGAVGLPIVLGREVLGVMEFFSFAVREPDDELLRLMVSIGSQVGQFIERKQSEQALRISESKSRAILAALPDMICQLSPKGVFIEFHASTAEEAVCSGESVLGKSVRDVLGAVAAERLLSAMAAALATGRVQTVEYQTTFGGNEKAQDYEARVAPMSIAGFLVVARNVADRKRLQCQLAQAQKLESIGQLAAGIAHEINTPIQYIGDNTRFLQDSFARLARLLEEYESVLADAQAARLTPQRLATAQAALQEADVPFLVAEIPGAIEQSLQGIDRVATIVRAMKDFSHPDIDQKQLTDINHCIESTILVARNEWKYAAEMVTELEGGLPLVSCLAGDLNQVILNLIVNASHAIADVAARGAGAKGTITIGTRQSGEWVEIRVADTGAGIPEAIRSRIFDPFFTTKEVGRGTGQGLAIAYSVVVDKHGGTLTFDSEVGRGTEFLIRLPLSSEAAAVREALC